MSASAGASVRRHGAIAETPELESAFDRDYDASPSELTEAFRKQKLHDISHPTGSISDRHDNSSSHAPEIVVSNEVREDMTETTPLLLPRERLSSYPKPSYDVESNQDNESRYEPGSWNRLGHHYPTLRYLPSKVHRVLRNPGSLNYRKLGRKVLVEPFYALPAVFLGLLLNLLDALSYGIILFPLGEEVFKDLGPDGVSMFYVSCIISQLVYSTGSIFRGGVGSEMIEVVPFFHKMTYLIMGEMGTANPAALRATVIVSYAMSSIITGLVFFGLGAARLGTLVNFFPHSILTGCIGGVGIFLFITGLYLSISTTKKAP